MGRPTILNDELAARIIESVRRGNFYSDSARCAGIHPQTLNEWLRKGEGEDAREPYASFALEIARAEAEAVAESVQEIREHGREDFRAHAWFLERRRYADWGNKQKIEHGGEGGGPVQIRFEPMPPAPDSESE